MDYAHLMRVVERFGGLNAKLGDAAGEVFGALRAERGKSGRERVGLQSCGRSGLSARALATTVTVGLSFSTHSTSAMKRAAPPAAS